MAVGKVLAFVYCIFTISVIIQISEADKREAVSTGAKSSQMIGKFLLTATGRILIFDTNQRLIVNQTFQDMDQLPVKSAIWHTARMAVINGVAYIGGKNGYAYALKLPIDYLEAVLAGESLHGDAKVNVTKIKLPFSCITEVFVGSQNGVIAACYNDTNSTLYVVNIHSPSDKKEIPFTNHTDFSNLLPIKDVFYYVQNDHLLRVDIARGAVQMETLEGCGQAWLKKNQHYNIIIDCETESFPYVPEEWSAHAYGIKHGAWKNRNVHLEQCHGSPYVFSVDDDTTVTLYSSQNDFKNAVTLSNTEEIVCTWNNGLTLMNRNENCNCWEQHLLTDQLTIMNSSFIPYSEGTLSLPLIFGVFQGALLFNSTYFLLPARHQLFFDLHNNVVHPMITDDYVIFHTAIYPVVTGDSHINSVDANDGPEDDSTNTQWPVYAYVVLAATVIVLCIVAVILAAFVIKYRRPIWSFFKRKPHLPIPVDEENSIQNATTEL